MTNNGNRYSYWAIQSHCHGGTSDVKFQEFHFLREIFIQIYILDMCVVCVSLSHTHIYMLTNFSFFFISIVLNVVYIFRMEWLLRNCERVKEMKNTVYFFSFIWKDSLFFSQHLDWYIWISFRYLFYSKLLEEMYDFGFKRRMKKISEEIDWYLILKCDWLDGCDPVCDGVYGMCEVRCVFSAVHRNTILIEWQTQILPKWRVTLLMCGRISCQTEMKAKFASFIGKQMSLTWKWW